MCDPLPGYLHSFVTSKRTPKNQPQTLHHATWFVRLRLVYTFEEHIKPRFCFHIAEFVMCRQPHQKSGCKQPRSSACTPPLQKALGASHCGLHTRGDSQGRVTQHSLCCPFSLLTTKHQGSISVRNTLMKWRVRWLFSHPALPSVAFQICD